MIVNPCTAMLVPGFYGTSEGYLTRTKSVWNPTFGAPSCGYIIWVPEFTSGLGAFDESDHFIGGNLFYWQSESTSFRPANTDFNPGLIHLKYGSQPNNQSQYDTTLTLDDPALQLNIGTARDVRAISACMRMSYFGRLDTSAGQVGFIENLPLADILGGDSDDILKATQPMNVDELFRVCTKVQRLGVDTVEAVHRPSTQTSGYFMSEHDTAVTHDETLGGSVSIASDVARNRGMTCFGLVWRGTQELASADALGFEFVKNVEWRPRPAMGLTHVTPHVIPNKSVDRMVAHIDSVAPGVFTRVVDTAKSGVARLLDGVYAGVEEAAHNRLQSAGFAAAGAMLAL